MNTQLLAKVDQLMKVGRNNFRPPPKVESRVVRIELRNPPPPVNFTEWDGLVRLLFNRKHKTCRALLVTKPTLRLLEENFRTFLSMNNEMIPDPFPDIKQIVEEVLAATNYAEQRAARMDIDDFLALLVEFNNRGIHFS